MTRTGTSPTRFLSLSLCRSWSLHTNCRISMSHPIIIDSSQPFRPKWLRYWNWLTNWCYSYKFLCDFHIIKLITITLSWRFFDYKRFQIGFHVNTVTVITWNLHPFLWNNIYLIIQLLYQNKSTNQLVLWSARIDRKYINS